MLFVRLFKFVVSFAFCLNLCLLLFALSSPYYDPANFWLPSLFGLFFKIFVAFHLFFVLIFLIGRHYRIVLFSVIVLLLCIPPMFNSSAFHFLAKTKIPAGHFKIMTYNINGFEFYQDAAIPALIFKTIHEEAPDIICFQEYFMSTAQHFHTITRMQRMGYAYYYEYITDNVGKENTVGQAVFSKIPFSNVHPIPFDSTANGAFSVDFGHNGDTFRLFNIHFQSITLRAHETKIPNSLKDFKSPQKDYYRMLFTKLRWAFQKRSRQVRSVKDCTDHAPYKVIVCGDFNDTPLSYTYRQMTEKLDDTFLETNFGLGSTYAGRIPLQRIDYILTDPSIKVDLTTVVHCPGSDHYPLVSSMSLK
jgi:endonuclease/exonuclease/phosphatase family metal-dependent hydrolase